MGKLADQAAPDHAPAPVTGPDPKSTQVETPAGSGILGVQREAGNRAAARLAGEGVPPGRGRAGAPPGRGPGPGSGPGPGPGRRLSRVTPTGAKAAHPKARVTDTDWSRPPRRADDDALFDALDDAVSLSAHHEVGTWAILLIYGGQVHLFEQDQTTLGVYPLDPAAHTPADGFYISSALSNNSAAGWGTQRLATMGVGQAWVPWNFTDRTSFLSVDELVISAQRAEFRAKMPAGVDHLAVLSTTADAGAGNGAQARAQAARARATIAKAKQARAGDPKAPGDPKDPKTNPPAPGQTRDLPDTLSVVETKDDVHLRITLDGRKLDIPYKDGESDAALLERVKAATLKTANGLDVSQSVRVQGSDNQPAADQIDRKPGLGGVKLPDGFKPTPGAMVANTAAYPAKIISHGPDGSSPQPRGQEDTVVGATINFTMELDYAALSYGTSDEVFNRMQTIAYRWELLDLTNLNLDKLPVKDRKAALETKEKEQGEATTSGIGRDLGRKMDNIGKDARADLDLIIAHPENVNYLSAIAISAVVDMGGALISAFFSLLSQPLEDRSIAFNKAGVYMVRCFAQPVVTDDDAQRVIERTHKPPVIHAPSAGSYTASVTDINARATQVENSDLANLAALNKLVDNPPFGYTADDIRKQLTDAAAFQQENVVESTDHQVRNADAELEKIRQWREFDQNATSLEQRPSDLRIWHAQLDMQGIEIGSYAAKLADSKTQLAEARARYTGFGLREIKKDTRAVKPRMTLVSEIDGQVYSIVANLYETTASTDTLKVWRLADVTSASTQDKYEGTGKTHQEAIQAAVDNFRDNAGYGRGSLAMRLPGPQLLAMTGEVISLRKDVEWAAPGERARAINRLKSLATAAEIAGMVVTGPIGMAIGAAGAVASAAVAIEAMHRRAGAERFKVVDWQTAMDVISVIGAVIAVGGLAAAGARGVIDAAKLASEGEVVEGGVGAAAKAAALTKLAARAEQVGDFIHILGHGMMVGQVIIVPLSLYHELAEIDKEEAAQKTPDGARFRARRLEAWAGALKSGLVQVRMAQLGADSKAGYDPFREPTTPSGPPARSGGAGGGDETAPKSGGGVDPAAPKSGGAVDPAAPKPGADNGGPPAPPPPPSSGAPRAPRETNPATKPTIYAPDHPLDVSSPAAMRRRAAEALGAAEVPRSGRIQLVDASLVRALWERAQAEQPGGGAHPDQSPDAIYDDVHHQMYVSRTAFENSPEMRQAAVDGVLAHMNTRGRAALSDPVARVIGETVLQSLMEGAPTIDAATPQARALQQRLTELVGAEMMTRLLYGGEVGAFASKLEAQLGSAHGNALRVALRGGDVPGATRLAGETNPALSNAFGQLMEVCAFELLAGASPKNELRAAMARQLADMVGRDVIEDALFSGKVTELRAALEDRLGTDGAAKFVAAMNAGDVKGAGELLKPSQPNRPAAVDAPALHPPLSGETPAPRTTEPPAPKSDELGAGAGEHGAPTGEHAPAARPAPPRPIGASATSLRDAIIENQTPAELHDLALSTIAETASFTELRNQVRDGFFGDASTPKLIDALQTARARVLKDVQDQIAAALKEKYPGIEVTFENMGTPGFKSDMDFTVAVKPGKASVNDAISASIDGVRAAYDVLTGGQREAVGDGYDGARAKVGQRSLAPNVVLDSNFYTELHEPSQKPRSPAERLAISEDQSVVSYAEERMNMPEGDWPAFREKLLESFKDPEAGRSTRTERDINALARQRIERQLAAADRLYNELKTPGQTPEQQLHSAQEKLLQALAEGAPPREVRLLAARIKLLEPDAYGTRAAKVGVVDRDQGAARAADRHSAEGALASGADKSLSAREQAALVSQEGAASNAKLRHIAPAVGATTSQAISAAKYLGRVFAAFRRAGLSLQSPLIDRTGAVIGAKSETESEPAAMGEMKAWAQDSDHYGLTDDQQVRDAFVQAAKALGDEMSLRLRRHEAVAAGMDPTAGEEAALAASRTPPTGGVAPAGSGAPPVPGAPPGPGARAPTPGPPGGFTSAADVRGTVQTALGALPHAAEFMSPRLPTALDVLGRGTTPEHRLLQELFPIVRGGLRTPELYAAVMADAYSRAVANGSDINGGLLEMARESGLGIQVVDKLENNDTFFRDFATKRPTMVDHGAGADHGVYSHLLQDLVVDRALRAAGRSESPGDFRVTLGKVTEPVPGGNPLPLGDLLWRNSYDEEANQLNSPELLRQALRPLGFE